MTADNKPKCKATIRFGDDYGDNSTTFHCQREEGHERKHREEGDMGCEEKPIPYILEWEGDSGSEDCETLMIREISDEEAEKEILEYYRTYGDASHYPDAVACDLWLDLKQVVRICDKLIKEGKIEVEGNSMNSGVREP